MNRTVARPLKVFLCHASGDKPPVREFYKRLVSEGVDAWLDQEKLLPGQDWRVEIPRAVQEADVVIVFLSKKSVSKEGYVQKEIKFALDIAEEKPEGTIFLIPARLEDCLVPERLSRWQWVDLYDENGFVKLLRSLKLRAGKIGAVIEPTLYVDTDKEFERRLEQLYTEGLAAFWVEDWDKACQRFKAILSECPSYANATEKLAEAERQRNLAMLYARSAEAYKTENWQTAIKSLEELFQKSADYKDAVQLLKNARKQKRLKDLYFEATTLHSAQKWQAVLKVFEQISAIEPTYPDPENLLTSAQKEVAELSRLAELNEMYSQAVRDMDTGQWVEARKRLEQIHKSQIGFLETERLLRKVEDEIAKVEEQHKRTDQINTLYEQAHGLARSKKWRRVVEKIEEIRSLDDRFVDKDRILDEARRELEREEGETQRQNELAAMYAEAVRLLKEEKYQEALDKLHEVKAVDPKYPDRQRVQPMARKQISSTNPRQSRLYISRTMLTRLGIVGVVLAAVIMVTVLFLTKQTVSDDFDNPLYDGTFNNSIWSMGTDDSRNIVRQKNGSMSFASNGYKSGIILQPVKYTNKTLAVPSYIESSFMFPAQQNGGIGIHVSITERDGFVLCQIWGGSMGQVISCQALNFDRPIQDIKVINIDPGTWHTARIEINPSVATFLFYIDGEKAGEFTPPKAESYKSVRYNFYLWSGCDGSGCTDQSTSRVVEGFFDYVKIGPVQ